MFNFHLRIKLTTAFFSSILLVVAFQNCGLNLQQKSLGLFRIEEKSTFQGSVCEEELYQEFKKSGGYHEFLNQNCQACHDGKNHETPRFAHADSVIAFSKFFEKEIEGNGAISDRAISNHQPGYTGTKHQNIIDQLRLELHPHIEKYQSCSGQVKNLEKHKTPVFQLGRFALNGIQAQETLAYQIYDQQLQFTIQLSKKTNEQFISIQNPMMSKIKEDENSYVVLGMNILINGVVEKSMTMNKLMNASICHSKNTRLMPSSAVEIYYPNTGQISPNDTIQFEFTEIKKIPKTNANCTPFESLSVFAGNIDRRDGIDAQSATFRGEGFSSHFVVHPSGDIYIVDFTYGLRKYEARTGQVTTVIDHTTTFSESFTSRAVDEGSNQLYDLPDNPKFVFGHKTNITIDHNGKIYLGLGTNSGYNVAIFQLDMNTKKFRRYVGGKGTDNSAGKNSLNVQVAAGGYAFDTENTFYFWSYCGTSAPNSDSESINAKKVVLRVKQKIDGSADLTESVFGHCASIKTNFDYGASASEQRPITGQYPMYSQILPILLNNQTNLFINVYNFANFKIANGILYKSNISFGNIENGFVWDSTNSRMIQILSSGAKQIQLNFASNDNDTVVDYFSSRSSTNDCAAENVSLESYCGALGLKPQLVSGRLYVSEGVYPNMPGNFRIRVIENNSIRTVVGRLNYQPHSTHRLQQPGAYSGIYFKKLSEPNQESFPSGLYFVDRSSMILGYVEPNNEHIRILWGNQSKTPAQLMNLPLISNQSSMGFPYPGGSGASLTFDQAGLPWIRVNHDLVQMNDQKQIILKTSNRTTEYLPERRKNGNNPDNNVNPANYGMFPYGGLTNLAVKNNGAFFLPNFFNDTFDPIIAIRYLDYTNNRSPQIIGGTYGLEKDSSGATLKKEPSSDIQTAGNVSVSWLYSECRNSTQNCYLLYEPISDRLFVSEKNAIRYIEKPTDLTASTLRTVLTTDKDIQNFQINPSRTQIWYIKDKGLYCFPLIEQNSTICDPLKEYMKQDLISNGWTFENGPNQLTFKNDETLYISTYTGLILEFNLPLNLSNTETEKLPSTVKFTDLIGSNIQLNAFAAKCMSCHDGATARGGLDLSNYENSKAKMDRIATRIQATTSPMPPTSSSSLSPYEKQLILKWIQDGGPN